MTSLFLALFLVGVMLVGLRRPFIWVLAYLYVDIVSPQKISISLLGAIPVSLIAFLAAFASWLVVDRKDGMRFTFRQGLILALLVYCGLTTINADFPDDALAKWDWVWKALLFAAFLPLTLRTRLRIEAAILVVVLSLAAIVISGGIKTIAGGGGYGTLRLLVNDNTGLYESSIISTVCIAAIPLALFLAKRGTIFPPGKAVSLFTAALILASCLIPIGTAARTGLLCLGLLCIMMLRTVQHRFMYLVAAAAVAVMAVPFLPSSYTDRMSTIRAPAADESASSRLAVWKWTLDYVREHPFGGGFDVYRANSFTYRMPVTEGEGNTAVTNYIEVTDEGRAFHSSYFEMLGEQGWPGLILWLLLNITGVIQMERIARRWKKRAVEAPDDASVGWQAPLATALQQAHLVYLLGCFFVGIAFQPVMYMIIGFQIALANLCRESESSAADPRRKRRSRRAGNPGDAVAPSGDSGRPAMP